MVVHNIKIQALSIEYYLNLQFTKMRQLPNEQTNDYDDLEDVNVCLEDNRDDQVDELVQRSLRKIKRKEQAHVSHLLKFLVLFLVFSVVLGGLFQHFIGFSSIKNYLHQRRVSQKEIGLVQNTVQQKAGSQQEVSKKVESIVVSDVKTEPQKEESKVANKVDSRQAAKQLTVTDVKKQDSANIDKIKNESDQKKKQQVTKSAQELANNKQNKDEHNNKGDSKQDIDKSKDQQKQKEKQKQKQIEQELQKQKQKQKYIQQQKEREKQKQRQTQEEKQKQIEKEKQKQKQKQQEQKRQKQKRQKQQEQQRERQRKQKQQEQQKERQRKQKQQEQQKERQRKQKQQEQQKERQRKQKQQEQQKERQRQKQIEEQKEKQKKKQEGFAIPRNLWTLSARPNYFQVLVGLNHQRYAQASGFTKNIINKQDYSKYLSEEGKKKLQNLFNNLADKIKNQQSNLQNHIQQIQKKLILLSVLYQNGGIIIDDQLTVTQNFDWIKHIDNNVYVNRGNLGVQPKIVGFYSPYYSSSPQKYNKKTYPGMEEVDKYTVLIPTIENYFLAAEKKAEYIGKLIDECINILQAPQQIKKDVAQKRYNYINVDDHDVYYQYFMIASQRILLTKQKELDSSSNDPLVYNFAIDYFGLNLINCYYGPYKTSIFFQNLQSEQKMQIIAKQDLSQLQSHIGPLRYVSSTSVLQDLSDFLSKIQKKSGSKKHKVTIMKGSWLQKMYFPNSDEPFIIENTQKPFRNQNAELWKELPKTIWIFWDKGLTNVGNVPAEVILCVQNLKKIAEASQFTVKQVNDTNLKDYLSENKISKIDQALDNLKDQKNFKQIRCDLYRLALLQKHGGVYLDTSVIAVQNLNWLLNIARLPSNMIQNRHGQLPQVLMFWDGYFGDGVQWKINEAHHTKSQWLLQYQNSFIAAIKDSQFIKEWLDLFLELSEQSASTIIQTFQNCNVPNTKKIDEGSHSLLSINTAKCVLGRKQQSLKKSSKKKGKGGVMDYYGVWTINSFLGPFKFKAINNLENLYKNGGHHFLTRYPQQYVEGIVGKFNFFVKLTESQRDELTKFFRNNDKALVEESHSQSVFRKYLYTEKYSKFQTVNGRTIIKLD